MPLFKEEASPKELFLALYNSETEESLENFINSNPDIFQPANWFPIGGNESNYGIIENQQSNPIAALVEKVTNSIDAILTKKCLESGVEPDSLQAPRSMEEAIKLFFPEHKNWDLPSPRKKQALDIQVIADGPPRNTSVIIYDNGEGQHPDDFDNTFLSLVRGNKNKTMFVQGKYNMGGSGAIVFCGKKGYQLIASKKFDDIGQFGFTLVREHPFAKGESEFKKNTWYEFLKIDGKIPAFDLKGELDLKLLNRKFKTGSIIKMYSYQFPTGYYGFAQDLNQSLNEFLFEPVLPIYTVDNAERYPNNKILDLDLFGLKRRLENESNYIDDHFSEIYLDELFGEMKVTCYVFKAKVGKNDVKQTKENIRRQFFKNNMTVMFSINGQAHGHYTSEFITRTLKFNLLKDYLLIHVDCTKMKYEFRKELFMASRDRLKEGDEARELREYLGKKMRKSKLDDINRHRKESIGLDSEDTNELLKSFAKNLPKDSDLFKLLQNTLKLEEKRDKETKQPQPKKDKSHEDEKPFNPKRFPSFFKLHSNKQGERNVIMIPLEGEKVIKFDTDVENQYFDRSEEPGDLEIALLDIKKETSEGGDKPGDEKEIGSLLTITKSSPNNGTIKLSLSPGKEINVGDEVQIKVTLTGAGENFEELLLIKIKDKEAPKVNAPKEDESLDNIGLPELIRVKEEQWKMLEDNYIEMGYNTVMYPVGEGNTLEKIYINLDSKVFLSYRAKLKSENQIQVAEKRYLASVYFHTLFLYMITKKRNYKLQLTKDGNDEEVTVDEYIRDVFDSYYSDFLLNFGMEQLISSLED
jgi:Histidine kinase-, DNA gyrase B-, and HSP90-like ATPase